VSAISARPVARASVAVGCAAGSLAAWAAPASAHGIGGRGDLPLPLWQVAWAAIFAVAISFVALGLLWTTPKLARSAPGTAVPAGIDGAVRAAGVVARVLAFGLFVVVVAAAWFGSANSAINVAPVTIYVVFWVGGQLVSALVGDVWAALSPFDTIAAIGQRLRRTGARRSPSGEGEESWAWSHWPATAGIFGFLWLELAYHSSASPRVLAGAVTAYTAALTAGAVRWGRSWLRVGDGFAALFGLLAAMAPLFRDETGRLCVRWPFAGLASVEPRRGTAALVLVTLGGTSFDGLTRTELWQDLTGGSTGWALTAYSTVGLVWMIGLVAVLYHGATQLSARVTGEEPLAVAQRYVHSLVPIMLAYAIAHYFSLVVFEGQGFPALLSDPLGRGWDLVGTADWTIDYLLVSTAAIGWVQVVSVVAGHIAGVTAAHDRAVESTDVTLAVRSQYPMVTVMILYTVGALVLLLGA
jgi:hypothetical protein